MDHAPVSLDRIDERQRELRDDLQELKVEMQRTRARLHNLEGFAGAYLDTQKVNRRQEERQYRRLELRLQVLTVVVALAAIVVPIVLAITTGK